MSNEVICKNCGAVMFEYTEYLMLCPNCDNEAYPDEEDPDFPGEIMQLMPEPDYEVVYHSEFDTPAEAPWEYMNDYEEL